LKRNQTFQARERWPHQGWLLAIQDDDGQDQSVAPATQVREAAILANMAVYPSPLPDDATTLKTLVIAAESHAAEAEKRGADTGMALGVRVVVEDCAHSTGQRTRPRGDTPRVFRTCRRLHPRNAADRSWWLRR
jgi:hypothetical protein